mgnify:CR=1 FL=1
MSVFGGCWFQDSLNDENEGGEVEVWCMNFTKFASQLVQNCTPRKYHRF